MLKALFEKILKQKKWPKQDLFVFHATNPLDRTKKLTGFTMTENQISGHILHAAIEVHKHLGPGLLESSYQRCLSYELQQAGLRVVEQRPLPLVYKGEQISLGYRLDLLVEEKVIVEIKSVQEMHPNYEAQLLTYLKLSGCRLGLLINFNVPRLIDGYRRYARNL